MTWLNKVKKPKPTLLIKVVIRPKGLILKGKEWDAFSWNDSKQTTQVLNAMTKALSLNEPVPTILMKPGTDGKATLTLGEGTCIWVQNDNGFTSDLFASGQVDDSNEPDELF